jgi:hypothetical protein
MILWVILLVAAFFTYRYFVHGQGNKALIGQTIFGF